MCVSRAKKKEKEEKKKSKQLASEMQSSLKILHNSATFVTA